MQLSEAANTLNAAYRGENVWFRGVSTDTRTLSDGNLFVALSGPNFDGHDYLDRAQQKGAAAAAVSRAVAGTLPLVEVEDTRLALGELAAYWRGRFELPLIAVTGSNGKTTVKEMLAAIVRRCGPSLVTRGNFNNDIGVPHTLFGLDSTHRHAVVELGANHPGEIAYLARMVRPTVAVVNNAGPAHLEGFGSIEGVARAKGELFDVVDATTTCVINADDAWADLWKRLAAPRPVITFGLEPGADVSASWRGDFSASDIELHTPRGSVTTHVNLPGRHNVMNALAAAAAALAAGIDLDVIAAGLDEARTAHGRWESRPGFNGARIVDDTYNANPASLRAGLGLLAEAGGEAWLVLGSMAELGENAEQLHRDMGEAARRAGVQRLFALGQLAGLAANAFGQGGVAFDSADDLDAALRPMLHGGVTVLVKGSRAMQMERVVEALCADALPSGRSD